LVKGISNLIADLMISLIVMGFFTAVLASTTHMTNSIRTSINQAKDSVGHIGKCVLGWLLVSNGSKEKLIIGNPFNRSVRVKVLVSGLKEREVQLSARSILELTVNLGSNAGDLVIVGPDNCVSRVQEVILP